VNREACELILEEVCVRVGDFSLDRVSFRVSAGSRLVLVGPPGCGKTVTGETICGLRHPSAGRLLLGARDITHMDPARRHVGYVPQDYVLLPHRDVAGNLALGLEARGWSRARRGRRVAELAEQLGIAHLLKRRVRGLSGGEQQRVALGRALAFAPELLVLDEPLSALDENTRDDLLGLLTHIQRTEGVTTVHVCHSFEEMMLAGETLAVMRAGRVEQTGAREEVLRRPRTRFVAEFLRARNILPAEARSAGETSELRIGPVRLVVAEQAQGKVWVVVRPEDITVVPVDAGPHGRITGVADLGRTVRVEIQAGPTWQASVGKSKWAHLHLSVGDGVRLDVPPEAVHVVEPDDEADSA